MKKLRVIQPSDRSFEDIDNFIESGGKAFSVSRYGYENLKMDNQVELTLLVVDSKNILVRILRPFLGHEANNLVLQLLLIIASFKHDVIYYASDRHPYLISFARLMGICRAPVLMLCHFTFNTRLVKSQWKKLILRLERWLVFNGLDRVLFLSDRIMQTSLEDYNIPSEHQNLSYWGADLSYFADFQNNELDVPEHYYFSSGGALRDYATLIDAFRQLPYKLILSCPEKVIRENSPLPGNVIHYNFSSTGMKCFADLRSFYQGAKAVLIPILEKNHVANGNSTFVEALACGKPVIISDTGNNFLDVEDEKIGIKVSVRDIKGWIRAVKHLEKNREKYEMMRDNSLSFAQKFCNYELFSKTVTRHLKTLK